jgi:hypothetical protein
VRRIVVAAFALFDLLSGGAQVGPTVCAGNVAVSDGLFTVQLIASGQNIGSGSTSLLGNLGDGSSGTDLPQAESPPRA